MKERTPEQEAQDRERERKENSFHPFGRESFDRERKLFSNPVSPRTIANFKALARAEGFKREDGSADVGAAVTALVEAFASGKILIATKSHKDLYNIYMEDHRVPEEKK